MKCVCALAVLLALGALPFADVHAEPLGRLFFTPERRAELERQRDAGTAPPTTTDTTARVDGIVSRSSGGKLTVWVNGWPRLADSGAISVGPTGTLHVGSVAAPR